MRPSFAELMHGLFYLAMALTIMGVGVKGCTVLDGIERRQQQSTVHHEKLMAQHDAMMQRFARPDGH